MSATLGDDCDSALLSSTRLHPLFGLEVHDLAIGAALPQGTRDALVEALAIYGVVVVRGQDITDATLGGFASSLGPIWQVPGLKFTDPGGPVFRLSNLDDHDEILPLDAAAVRSNIANELWHTDATFIIPGASVSMLHARIIPPSGGQTEFCDTRVAYEDLSDAWKRRLEGLVAHHSIQHSRALTGYHDYGTDNPARTGGAMRPLVRPHAASGRTALCLASHISRIEGLSAVDGAALVAELTDLATQPDRVYRHDWQVGDLVMWNNLCTMHRARPYNMEVFRRDMRSVRLADEADL